MVAEKASQGIMYDACCSFEYNIFQLYFLHLHQLTVAYRAKGTAFIGKKNN